MNVKARINIFLANLLLTEMHESVCSFMPLDWNSKTGDMQFRWMETGKQPCLKNNTSTVNRKQSKER
jgi:hypothetical protein